MIHIEKEQKIAENENIIVYSPSGDYNDFDLIEYCQIDNPNVALGAFQAQFVKYGGLVYQFNEPAELGDAILAIDPESTHSAASLVRMQKELLSQFGQGSLQGDALAQITEQEQNNLEELKSNEAENNKVDTQQTEQSQSGETSVASSTDAVSQQSNSTKTESTNPNTPVENQNTESPIIENQNNSEGQTSENPVVPITETISEIVNTVENTVEAVSNIVGGNN